MPSAKSNRAALRKRDRNLPLRSRAKTFIRSARGLLDDGDDVDAAEQAVRAATIALDKAAAKGALHPNNAARRKSRLMSQLSRIRKG